MIEQYLVITETNKEVFENIINHHLKTYNITFLGGVSTFRHEVTGNIVYHQAIILKDKKTLKE